MTPEGTGSGHVTPLEIEWTGSVSVLSDFSLEYYKKRLLLAFPRHYKSVGATGIGSLV